MNRPSRSDDTEKHPDWNQNPPFLAPDLTTCEDLNGIANSREHRGPGSDSDRQAGLGSPIPERHVKHTQPPRRGLSGTESLGQRSCRPCPLPKGTVAMALTSVSAPPRQSPVGRRIKAVLSWTVWGLSVLATSLLLNRLNLFGLFHLFGSQNVIESPPMIPAVISPGTSPVSAPLTKRACGSGNPASEDEYNTPLHVGALIIILLVSGLSCAFSMIMKKIPRVRVPFTFFFVIRHFGTGVLIATAFVHLLPTAFISLGDPCLSGFWTTEYPAMPGAIAMAGIFFVTIIEMVFSPHRVIHGARPENGGSVTSHHHHHRQRNHDQDARSMESDTEMDAISPAPASRAGGMTPVHDLGPMHRRRDSVGRQLSIVGTPTATAIHGAARKEHGDAIDMEQIAAGVLVPSRPKLTPEQQHKKDILQCMMLEMGILFHSVFIGMALSVSVGNEFIILLVAIIFHQSFEGLALGARIASIDWPDHTWQPWLMALAYGCTTPIGQAIGLAIHNLYAPDSELGLVLVGTMNAISSGLLVFASLIELLSEDFLSDESWKELRGMKRVYACLLVFAGAFGMSVVGAWA